MVWLSFRLCPCLLVIVNIKLNYCSRDEGIVLKDLGSKWEPGDRSGKWLKLKPDYIHAASDLDVLIIGSYFLLLPFDLLIFLERCSNLFILAFRRILWLWTSGRRG